MTIHELIELLSRRHNQDEEVTIELIQKILFEDKWAEVTTKMDSEYLKRR